MNLEGTMQAIVAPESLVRSATSFDFDPVVDLLRAANAEFAEVLPTALYEAYLASVLDIQSRMDVSELYVAEDAGCIVGVVTYYPDASRQEWGWPAHWAGIRTVAVMPAARGRGIGRALVQTCIDRARAQDAPAICLHTGTFMHGAIALYERMGFQRIPDYDLDVSSLFDPETGGLSPAVPAYWLDPRA